MASAKTHPSLIHEACEVFKGPHGALAWFALLLALGFFALFIYAAWRFCQLLGSSDPLYWAAIAGFALLALAMLKLWFWLMMLRNSIVRDLKK